MPRLPTSASGSRSCGIASGILIGIGETRRSGYALRRGGFRARSASICSRRVSPIPIRIPLAIPFTSGILIGIGETRRERIDALSPESPRRGSTGTSRRSSSRTSARSRGRAWSRIQSPRSTSTCGRSPSRGILLGPGWHVQAPPNLAYDDFPRLLDAGIDDWGGVSPVTVDHVNPEAPWPEIERLARGDASRGLELAPRLPVYPEYVAELDRWCDQAVAPYVRRAADAPASPARTPGRRASRRGPVRRPGRRAPARADAGTSSARTSSTALPSARRGARTASSPQPTACAARSAATRSPTSSPGTSSTRTSATSAAASARSRRGSSPRTCAARRTSCRSRDRPASGGGLGARRDRGLPPGRDPPRVHGRLLRGVVSRRSRMRCPGIHVHAFSALEVWQGAATLGSGSRSTSRASASRARLAPGHRGRGAR